MKKIFLSLILIFIESSAFSGVSVKNFSNSNTVICASKARGVETINLLNLKYVSSERIEWPISLQYREANQIGYKFVNHPTKKGIIYTVKLVQLKNEIKYGTQNVFNRWIAFTTNGSLVTSHVQCDLE